MGRYEKLRRNFFSPSDFKKKQNKKKQKKTRQKHNNYQS